ncbi:MAG: class I SAM-dependent methyltransferase [Thermoplasmatota archaeon]
MTPNSNPAIYAGNERIDIVELINRTPLKGIPPGSIKEKVDLLWRRYQRERSRIQKDSPVEMEGLERGQNRILSDIASTRSRSTDKYSRGEHLFFTSSGLRWATPEAAAKHCAERLRGTDVLDLTCGQGGQVIFLARTCRSVIAVDIDPMNCLITMLNSSSLGLENVTVVLGDCLNEDVLSHAEKGCFIFSDPARPPGAEERTMEQIVPNPVKVLDRYSGFASGACFEVPPYLDIGRIPFDCEAEYISIDGRLNRLNLYTGNLKKHRRSAVILPSGSMIFGKPGGKPSADAPDIKTGQFLHEVDPALVKAELLDELLQGLGSNASITELDARRTVLVSPELENSPFLSAPQRILAIAVSEDEVKSSLNEISAGSVTLRYNVDPSKYWEVRRDFEKGLKGELKVNLFKGGFFIITERPKRWDVEHDGI